MSRRDETEEDLAHHSGDDEKERLIPPDERQTGQTHNDPSSSSSSSSVPTALPVWRLTLIKSRDETLTVDAGPDWTLERLRNTAFTREVIENPAKTIVMMMGGRRFAPSALHKTLAELHVRPNTSLHFLLVDRPQHHGSFQNDPQAPGADRQVADMQYQGDFFAFESEVERQGTMCEFFVGAIMGALLGILALIWLMQPSITRLCRLGILMGVSFNFIFGLSRWFLLSPTTHPMGINGPHGARQPIENGFHDHREPVLIGPTKHG